MDKIRRFNDFCAQNYPSAEALTEEIVLDYCKKKKTESAKSCNNRIVGVRGFLKYANSRGFVNIPLPSTIQESMSHHSNHIRLLQKSLQDSLMKRTISNLQ